MSESYQQDKPEQAHEEAPAAAQQPGTPPAPESPAQTEAVSHGPLADGLSKMIDKLRADIAEAEAKQGQDGHPSAVIATHLHGILGHLEEALRMRLALDGVLQSIP